MRKVRLMVACCAAMMLAADVAVAVGPIGGPIGDGDGADEPGAGVLLVFTRDELQVEVEFADWGLDDALPLYGLELAPGAVRVSLDGVAIYSNPATLGEGYANTGVFDFADEGLNLYVDGEAEGWPAVRESTTLGELVENWSDVSDLTYHEIYWRRDHAALDALGIVYEPFDRDYSDAFWLGEGGGWTLSLGVEETTVPEPSTYALFALGALALGHTARRRSRKARAAP